MLRVGPQTQTWSVLDSLEYMAVLGFFHVLYMYTVHKEIYCEQLTHVVMTEVGQSVALVFRFQSEGWELLQNQEELMS